MTVVWRIATMAGVFLCCAGLATAQSPAAPPVSSTAELESAVAPLSDGAEAFDPAKYGIVKFDDYRELYSRLTEAGRCPPNEMAETRQPCAFIFYQPVGDAGQGFGLYFKPVFEVVSKDRIWAMHNKQLKKVSINNLYFDEPKLRNKPGKYVSIAVIGNAENRANCEQGRPCLSHLVAEDMFLMYKKIPDMVVEMLWGKRMVDPGTVVR